MAGADPKGHPAGTRTGDVLHVFNSGVFESIIDLTIDAAGNAWSTNNWNDLPVATGINDNPARSTWGGGTGSMSSMAWPSPCCRRAWARCGDRRNAKRGTEDDQGRATRRMLVSFSRVLQGVACYCGSSRIRTEHLKGSFH
jgi:hypothetical protein